MAGAASIELSAGQDSILPCEAECRLDWDTDLIIPGGTLTLLPDGRCGLGRVVAFVKDQLATSGLVLDRFSARRTP